MKTPNKLTKLEKSWILYDVGNSAFTLLVSTLLPIYFNALATSAGISEDLYLSYWGYAGSIATILVAFIGPVCGARSDRRGFKKPLFLTMVILGGSGSLTGSIIGAAVLASLPEALRDFSIYRMLIYSVVLVIVMIFKPSGIFGTWEFSLPRIIFKVFGKKIPEKFEMAITSVFLVLLLAFMAVVAINDVRKLFG